MFSKKNYVLTFNFSVFQKKIMFISFILNFINWQKFKKNIKNFDLYIFFFYKKLEVGVKEIIKFYHNLFLYKNFEGESKKNLTKF